MSIFVTGDIHGTLDIGKLITYFEGKENLSKDDYLIICGDVAVCGFNADEEKNTREILRNLPVTTLFCEGNHEYFPSLNSYAIEEWHGGKVHMIEDDIIHLMRGQIYDIDGLSFLVCGGAYSTYTPNRIEEVSWFPEEEIPSEEEYREMWNNLDAAGNKVDYIITHTGPDEVLEELGFPAEEEASRQTREFQDIADNVDFKGWYFGHMHVDEDVCDIYHCRYQDIDEIEYEIEYKK